MKKGCLIFGLVILGLLSVWLLYYFAAKMGNEEQVFETESPEVVTIVSKTVATGSINPLREVNIKPHVSGVVEELFLEAGELVEIGQEIAKIKLVPDAVSINNAESRVEEAKLAFDNAQLELNRQKKVSNQGQDTEQAKINLQEAERERDRQKALFDEGIISEQVYNTFLVDVELKRSALDNQSTSSDRLLDQYKADVELRRAQLTSARNNLKLLKEGASKKSSQASNVIRSTVKGMVLDIPIKIGSSVIESNTFNEGTTIAAVADMKNMIFEGLVDESEVGKLKEGMELVLTIGAIEDKTFKALLYYIAPKGKTDEGAIKFEIKASIELSEKDFIRAGYSANADIVLDTRTDVLAIKESVLQFGEEDTVFVEIQEGDGSYEKRMIETGLSDGINIEILDGLADGDKVKVPE